MGRWRGAATPLDQASTLARCARRVPARGAIDHPQFNSGERGKGVVVELDDIGRICGPPNAETERLAEAVALDKRHDRDPRRAERPIDFLRRERRPIDRLSGDHRPESIAEAPLGLLQCCGAGIEWDGMTRQLADHPQIVDAMQMVGMRMGQQDGIQPRDTGVQQLLAQIGRGVDQNCPPAGFDQQRSSAATVARLGRVAPPPIADRRPQGRQ